VPGWGQRNTNRSSPARVNEPPGKFQKHMSAYICDKKHITFLVLAAMSSTINRHGGQFRWYHNEEAKALPAGDYDRAAEVANILWRENIRSVSYRYPNDKTSATLPGPNGGSFVVGPADFFAYMVRFDPVQVLKSIDCLDYQSCEHPEWGASEAKAFLDRLTKACIQVLPGYDAAAWGAPEKKFACA
jgi:hypothetical protein